MTASHLGPCLEWPKSTNKGYGRVQYRRSTMYAHVVAWQAANGLVPEGCMIMHLCDNPSCYRLAHLKLGTHLENMADMVAKGRSHKSGLASLPPAAISEVLDGRLSSRALASLIGVPSSTIRGWRRQARGNPA